MPVFVSYAWKGLSGSGHGEAIMPVAKIETEQDLAKIREGIRSHNKFDSVVILFWKELADRDKP